MTVRIALLSAFLVLGACGEAGDAVRGVPAVDPWASSKPHPTLGHAEARVVARPAPDEAHIALRWAGAAQRDSCVVEIVLPDTVTLLDGARREEVTGLGAGPLHRSWVVRFPHGETLDAVVRVCGDTPRGVQACEVAVRLVDGPGEGTR